MKHTILPPLSRLLPVVAAASLTLLCAACTQDEAPAGRDETTQGADAVPLRIASVSVQPQAETQTRATTATPLQTAGEQIYITRILSGASTLRSTYTCTAADGWQPADPAQPAYLLPQSSKIVATYPIYNQTGTGTLNCYAGGIMPLPPPSDPSEVGINHAIDYCYEVKDMTNADPVAAFRLKHIMAKVQFHFMKGSDYGSTNPPQVTYIQMSHPMLAIQNTINLVNGQWTNPIMRPGSPAWSGVYKVTQTEREPSDGTYAEMLIIPASLYPEGRDGTVESTYLRFQFLVDGKSVSTEVRILDLPFYKDTDTSFDPGTRYKFDFILRPGGAEVKDVKMLAWETAPTIDGGETAETATDYVEILGTKWAKNDVMYKDGKFIINPGKDPTGETTGEAKKFQWDATNSYFNFKFKIGFSSNEMHVTDPCHELEPIGGWKCATTADYESIKKATQTTVLDNEWDIYFGTKNYSIAVANPERYLKLRTYTPYFAKNTDDDGYSIAEIGWYSMKPADDTNRNIRCVKAEKP